MSVAGHQATPSSADFTLPFLLERTAQVSIVVHQWRLATIDTEVKESEWDLYMTITRRRIQLLPLRNVFPPAPRLRKSATQLKTELTDVIISIAKGFRAALAVFGVLAMNRFDGDLMRCTLFSPLGTVDFRRSAEAIVDSGMLSPVEVYRFARYFCLENRIAEAWSVLDEDDRIGLRYLPKYPMGGPTDQVYDHYPCFRKEPDELTNLTCAVLDRNEVAVRHFRASNVPLIVKGMRQPWLPMFPSHCQAGVNLFLLSCYPQDEALHEELFRTSDFLIELFEWPYLDCFMAVVGLLKRDARGFRIYDVIRNIAFPEADKPIMRGVYFRTFHNLWMTLAEDDPDRLGLGSIIIYHRFFASGPFRGGSLRLARLLLQNATDLEKQNIIQVVSQNIHKVLHNNWVDRLDWIFETCTTEEEKAMYKRQFLSSTALKRTCWELLVHGAGGAAIVEGFWEWCGLDFNEIVARKWRLEHEHRDGEF